MKLCLESLKNPAPWQAAGIDLPEFDLEAMRESTARAPVWVHLGAGNIFRGFIARLQQDLLNQGLAYQGIVAGEAFDPEIIERVYTPFQNLSLMVSLLAEGTMEQEVVASVAQSLRAGKAFPQDMERLEEIFRSPTLQLVSLTITEKGYALRGLEGDYLPGVLADLEAGPGGCTHGMGILAGLLYQRFLAGGAPLAVVSMDNCSRNGEKLRESVTAMGRGWLERGLAPQAFVDWLEDESQVSFPWTMIDKITPRPAQEVAKALAAAGLEGMEPVVTEKNTYIAPFVNGEQPQYLVVEDRFPNGRPPLERAGVYMTDRETVSLTEAMKVTACLNPLHTALAVFGCLLGCPSIAAEMEDRELRALAEGIGWQEGLPAVKSPGIIQPEDFLAEVLEKRLPNPFLPDTPQRIATDTSQKVAIRFGETIKRRQAEELTCIPLAIAGWLRYLLGVDDQGEPMACSSDPMLEALREKLAGVKLGLPETAGDQVLAPILSNQALFGLDLCQRGLAPKIGEMLRQMLAGPGGVRATLKAYLAKA